MSLDYVGCSYQVIINDTDVAYGFSAPTGDCYKDAKEAAMKAFEKFLDTEVFIRMHSKLSSDLNITLSYCAHLDMPRGGRTTMTTQQAFNEAYCLLISGKACKLYRTDGQWYCSVIEEK